MRHIRHTLALVALALAAALPARAQQAAAPEPLVVTAENRTAAAEAARGAPRQGDVARPGDVVRYRLTFRNPGQERVRGVTLDNPVSAGMQYVSGSVRTSRDDVRTEFSADGGRSFSAQPMEEVVVDGARVRRPVPAERYTHVRWTIDGWVAPGAVVTAEFDARIGAGRSTAAPASGR